MAREPKPIHENVTYTKYRELNKNNWETLTPEEGFIKKCGYRKNAKEPDGLTIWTKGGSRYSVELQPGNNFTYSVLKDRDELLLDGEAMSYTDDSV